MICSIAAMQENHNCLCGGILLIFSYEGLNGSNICTLDAGNLCNDYAFLALCRKA